MFFPLAMLSQYVFGPALFLLSVFIVLIILLQRGRGGGLTGALGGAGGASAFGVKAGDIFTRITAISILLWIVLCALTTFWYLPDSLDIASDPASLSIRKSGTDGMGGMGSSEPITSETAPAETAPAETAPAETAPAETAPAETAPAETAPADNKAENSTPAAEKNVPDASPVSPIDLPPATTLPSATTESAVKPVPTDLPPAAEPAAVVPTRTEPKS